MVNGTDAKYDNLIFTQVSVTSNIILAIGKIIVGVVTGSYFFCVAGCFNFMMGGAKGTCLYGIIRSTKIKRLNTYIGCLLMLAGSVYALYMGKYILFPSESFKFTTTLAIAIAAVAFYEMGTAIYGIVKTREHTTLYRNIKVINLASSLTAIAFAQVALLSFNDDIGGARSQYNGVMGGIVGVICVILGLSIILAPHIQAMCIKYKTRLNSKRPIITYRISELGEFVNHSYFRGGKQGINLNIDYPYCEILLMKFAGRGCFLIGNLEQMEDATYILRAKLCWKKLPAKYHGKFKLITTGLKLTLFVVYGIPLLIYLLVMRTYYRFKVYARLEEVMGILGAVKSDLPESYS